MVVVPLRSIPNQTVTIALGGQPCQVDVIQKRTGLFLSLHLNGALIVAGALCQDRNPLVRSTYLGFTGDLMFFDTLGVSDPTYDGIGSRYVLGYFTAADFS